MFVSFLSCDVLEKALHYVAIQLCAVSYMSSTVTTSIVRNYYVALQLYASSIVTTSIIRNWPTINSWKLNVDGKSLFYESEGV